MKWIVLSAALAALPHWVSATLAGPAEEVEVKAQVYVVGEDEEAIQLLTTGSAEGDETTHRVVVLSGDDEDAGAGRQAHRVVKIIGEGDADLENRGWLGISVGTVPESVSAHTDTGEGGVIILNVLKDSPADRAGLEAHDIILSISGETAEGQPGRLAELVGAHAPGEDVQLKLLRNGEENIYNVVLGSRADTGALEWKFSVGPLAEIEEHVKTRGKFIHRGSEGEWIVDELGDLEELKELPEKIREFIPKSGTRSVQVFIEGDEKTVSTTVERDGTALVIEQHGDGEITVQRTDQNGRKTVATYANEDELREADEEAYEAYKRVGSTITLKLDVEGLEALGEMDFDFDFEPGEWKAYTDEWRGDWEDAFQEANEAYREAMEEFEQAMKQWKSQGGKLPKFKTPDALPKFLDEESPTGKFFEPGFLYTGKARQTFELREDGKIEVRIRKGDSELVQLYGDEADLAARNPKAYQKYQDLMSADAE